MSGRPSRIAIAGTAATSTLLSMFAAVPAASAATGQRYVVRQDATGGLAQGWDLPTLDTGGHVILPGPTVRIADADTGALRLGADFGDTRATTTLGRLAGVTLDQLTGVRFRSFVGEGAGTPTITLVGEDASETTFTPDSTDASWRTHVFAPSIASTSPLAEVRVSVPAGTDATTVVDMIQIETADEFVTWDFEPYATGTATELTDPWSGTGSPTRHDATDLEFGADSLRGATSVALDAGDAITSTLDATTLAAVTELGFAAAVPTAGDTLASLSLDLSTGATATFAAADQPSTTGLPASATAGSWYWLDAVALGEAVWTVAGDADCSSGCAWDALVDAHGTATVDAVTLASAGDTTWVDGLYVRSGTGFRLIDLAFTNADGSSTDDGGGGNDGGGDTGGGDTGGGTGGGGSAGGGGGTGETGGEGTLEGPDSQASTPGSTPASDRTPAAATSTTLSATDAPADVTTDGDGDGATASQPLELTIVDAIAGAYDLAIWDFSGTAEADRRFLGWRANVNAAPTNPAGHTLRFDLHASTLDLTAADLDALAVHLDGETVRDCTAPGTGPCVDTRTLTDGIVAVTVTVPSPSGRWTFSVAQPASEALGTACPSGRVPGNAFPDDDGNTHEDAIDCLRWWGITAGKGDGSYDPDGTVTRGQMATFLWRVLQRAGVPAPTDGTDWFSDDNGSTHEPAINALRHYGIYLGTSDGRSAHSWSVNRAQVASFLDRTFSAATTFDLLDGDSERFDDVSGTHAQAVGRLARAGIVLGVTDTTYGSDRPLKRSQMASLLMRLADALAEDRVAAVPTS